MLIEGQEAALLHRHSAPGDRMGVDHAVDIRARHMDRAGDREAAAIDLVIRRLDLDPININLDQR